MSASAAHTVPLVQLERSPLQRLKKLGGKFKKSKKVDAIPENSVPAVEAVEIVEEEEEIEEIAEDPAFGEFDIANPPEPTTLAERIRAVVSSLPAPPQPPRPVKTDPPPLDDEDKKFIELLSTADVMNGSPDDGRISVWEALNAARCAELAATKTVQVPLTHKDTLWEARWNLLWSYTVGLIKPTAPQTKLVTKWVPSTTQVSFQALWYLPPPVMAELSSDEAEAGILTCLGPYVGYISTFVSWIWGTVTNADKGYGVVLTATWILPVALIPSAIKAPDGTTTTPPVTTAPPVTPDAPTGTTPPVTTTPPTTVPPPPTVPPTTPSAPPATPAAPATPASPATT
ncbi:hypothetical protein B0H14DRAFT_2765982 [Mycena olivaceomarginata]|nr:hypothetical protein B0H14DRAFT_2765982 [Mycena olivaceomarginata]